MITYRALNMKRLLTHAFFNMFGDLFFEDHDSGEHDPTSCSDALSDKNENEYPCTDYVSLSSLTRSPLWTPNSIHCVGFDSLSLYFYICGRGPLSS